MRVHRVTCKCIKLYHTPQMRGIRRRLSSPQKNNALATANDSYSPGSKLPRTTSPSEQRVEVNSGHASKASSCCAPPKSAKSVDGLSGSTPQVPLFHGVCRAPRGSKRMPLTAPHRAAPAASTRRASWAAAGGASRAAESLHGTRLIPHSRGSCDVSALTWKYTLYT
jgi:hypothetical protein